MTAPRLERDSIGDMAIPGDADYGIHTARAVDNFPITGILLRHYPELVQSLAMAKKAAAMANRDLGALKPEIAQAIISACDLVIAGDSLGHFVVDMLQGGAGTSTNMNANEVIANIALKLMGRPRGDYASINPNDHVNLSQSTNDVYPTAVRLTILRNCPDLIAAQQALKEALLLKAVEFDEVIKVGRTQLMDAVPMRLGSEFRAFAVMVGEDIDRLREFANLLREVNLGGTAIGTGINTPEGYSALVIRHLSEVSGVGLVPAGDLIEATSDTGAFVTFSGVLKRTAVKLSKICNDLRLLNSGPRAGLGEIRLPAVQAGSSIMPGKVNPVIPEVVNQIAYQVIGNDLTVTLACEAGQLQLNAMEPVIVLNILQSMRMLTRGQTVLREKCILGIEADRERARELLEGSLVTVTALNPYIGYAEASRVAKEALKSRRSIRDVALAEGLMTEAQLAEAFATDNLLGIRR
ncbi:MAG: aspartate ammonia-lyase [Rhizobiales bacterium]|nr:aspartate ammonia-lyase [Hyphomicrobiales bacterium]MBI3673390.1 aspartate ammonia-lyase [Hyphomicrobiales bacterium]